jgi:hypothetical protein
VLGVDTTTHKVTLAAAYTHRPPRISAFLGSMAVLPNRNALVGWGSMPFFSEYSSSGKLLLDASWPGKDQSYRAEFSPSWIGTPFYPPSAAVRRSAGKTSVYASWNGATQVARWEVLGGSSASSLRRVGLAPRNGFETAISLGTKSFKVLEVRALDSRGKVLGTSKQVGHGKRGSSGLPQSY